MGCTLPKCAVINDLSGFGRCSLTVTRPILSAMGIQTCPLPTAILSNHTGYDNFYFADFTQHMREYYSKWDELNLSFDAIYTGFLGNAQQIEIILDFIDKFKSEKTLLFVDPVMGDNGDIYATYDKNLCSEMRRLVARADIITPNLTEACILAGVPYIDGPAVREKIFSV
ncbi:MAG: bifunctional hydroxymethylpyrimidine kinase/phosphomethylpyrimidine kinase, partial [Clostridia bacterium]